MYEKQSCLQHVVYEHLLKLKLCHVCLEFLDVRV